VRELKMVHCLQPTVTDLALQHIAGVKRLDMMSCNQSTITTAGFAHLGHRLKRLDMSGCSQPTITPTIFQHLTGLEWLDVKYCPQLRGADLSHLTAAGCVIINRDWLNAWDLYPYM